VVIGIKDQMVYRHLLVRLDMKNPLDTLLASSVQCLIEKNLGEETIKKVKDRLFERYGINLTQAIEDFHKFDSVLQEFFGQGAEGLEAKLLETIIKTEKTKENIKSDWITIQDQNFAKIFLEALGDPDKKAILNSVLDKPLIVAEILEICKVPQTSGYRKINMLIKDGLLIQNGQYLTDDRKRVTKYQSVFRNINIELGRNSVRVKTQMNKEIITESSILRAVNLN